MRLTKDADWRNKMNAMSEKDAENYAKAVWPPSQPAQPVKLRGGLQTIVQAPRLKRVPVDMMGTGFDMDPRSIYPNSAMLDNATPRREAQAVIRRQAQADKDMEMAAIRDWKPKKTPMRLTKDADWRNKMNAMSEKDAENYAKAVWPPSQPAQPVKLRGWLQTIVQAPRLKSVPVDMMGTGFDMDP